MCCSARGGRSPGGACAAAIERMRFAFGARRGPSAEFHTPFPMTTLSSADSVRRLAVATTASGGPQPFEALAWAIWERLHRVCPRRGDPAGRIVHGGSAWNEDGFPARCAARPFRPIDRLGCFFFAGSAPQSLDLSAGPLARPDPRRTRDLPRAGRLRPFRGLVAAAAPHPRHRRTGPSSCLALQRPGPLRLASRPAT